MPSAFVVIDEDAHVEGSCKTILGVFLSEELALGFIETLRPHLDQLTVVGEMRWVRGKHEWGGYYLEIKEIPLNRTDIPDDYLDE